MNELEFKRDFKKIVFALQDYCWTHQGYPSCKCIFYDGSCLIEEMMTDPFYGECEYLSPRNWKAWILGNEKGE